jgi:hypothetical protein
LIHYVIGFENRWTDPVEGEAQFSYSARDIPVARFNPAKWITRCDPFGRELGVGIKKDNQAGGCPTMKQE